MMQMLKACLNLKVVAALAVLGVGIYLVNPGLALAALPILVLAACPLSMFLMMRMMGMGGGMNHGTAAPGAGAYTCPMHPGVRSEQPGACPSCGMALQPVPGDAEHAQHAVATVPSGDALELQRRLDESVAGQARLSQELEALRESAASRTRMLVAADRLEADVDAALERASRDGEEPK